MLSHRSLAIAVVCVFLAVDCKISPFGNCTREVTILTVQPALDTLLVGGSVTLSAAGTDVLGLPPCSFAWTSSDSQIASIQSVSGFSSAYVKVVGRSPGSATVVVSAGGMTASSRVIVQ
jgi:uncharacterized protein YjdB